MIKITLTLVVLIFLVAAGLMVIGSQQPNEYEVSQNLIIEAPQAKVFAMVVDLENWRAWSPWYKRDPKMKMSYTDNPVGEGASVSWESGTEGVGTQTITHVIGTEAMKLRMDFIKPMEGTAYAYFKFKELEPNKTQVYWAMEAKNSSLLDKVIYFLLDVKSLVEKDFKSGLENLKTQVESSTKSE